MTPTPLRAPVRGQSETVGVVLLTAVVVVLAAVTGAAVIAKTPAETTPAVNVQVSATTQTVTLDHVGGDALATSDVDLVFEGDSRQRVGLDSFTQVQGSDSSRFAPGDIWEGSNPVSGEQVRVTAVHVPTNTVLDTETVDVTVTVAARIDYSPENPTPTDTIEFNGSRSTVKDSTITAWEWEFNGTTKNGETVTYDAPDDGTYPVMLTVTAADGRTATRTRTVTVYNEFPTAAFSYSPTNPGPGEDITVDAGGSSDSDGSIASYEWEFNDSGTVDATGQTATTNFSSAGNYSLRLTVTDNDGATDRESRVVNVGSGGGEKPVDPGFAYEDVNNDGRYSEADGDFRVTVSDGSYDAEVNGSSLVIPDSVSAISASSVEFRGRNVTIDTAVTSSGAVTVEATDTLDIAGRRIESTGGGQLLRLTGDSIAADGATIESAGAVNATATSTLSLDGGTANLTGSQTLTLSAPTLSATDATVRSDGALSVTGETSLDLSQSTVAVSNYRAATLDGGDLTATDADVSLYGAGTITASGALVIDGATVTTQNGGGTFSGASLSGVGADLDSAGSLDLDTTAGAMTLTDATVASDGSVAATASGRLDIDGAAVVTQGGGEDSFRAGTLTGVEATLDGAGSISISTTSGKLDLTDGSVTSDQSVTVSATGLVDIDGATVVTQGGGEDSFSGATVSGVGTTVDSAGSVSLDASAGQLTMTDAAVTTTYSISTSAFGALDSARANLDSGGSITATSTNDEVVFTDATLDVRDGSSQDVELESNGAMYVDGARLVGDQFSDFTGNRQTDDNTLYVDGAIFEAGNGDAKEFDISPNAGKGKGKGNIKNVDGTPQKGTVV